MNLIKTYIMGHMGGDCPSEPLTRGEMFFVGSMITLVVVVAFGVLGFIVSSIVGAFL